MAPDLEHLEVNLSKNIFLSLPDIEKVVKWMLNVSNIRLDDLADMINSQIGTTYRANDISRWLSDNPNDTRCLPANVLAPIMKSLGINYPLEWLAYHLGYEIKPAMTIQEKRIKELERLVEEERKEKETILKLIKSMKEI